MTPGIRPLVAGNWKMNGTGASLNELRMIGNGFLGGLDAETEALVCVPATLLTRASEILSRTPVKVGGQDCHVRESGAFTGCLSAEMLKDAGATHVIVGHSECRADRAEDDATVCAKASAAWRAGRAARKGADARRPVPPGCRFGSQHRDGRQRHRRLRAGLGDRHRADADGRRRRRGPRAYKGEAGGKARGGRGEDTHPLRRLGQAL